MAFAALTIDLNARLASFEEGLKRAERTAAASAGRMERAFGVAGKAMAALGGGALIAGLVGMTRSVITSAAALDDLAESTGGSVEGLSKLVDIARIGGRDIGEVETMMVRLTKALSGADDESKGAGAAFQSLGLRMQELRDLSPDQAIERVAKAFAEFEDGAGKTAAAMAIFGRGGAQMLPLLNDIAQNLDRASSATREQAALAETLEKRWNALGVSAENYARKGLFAVIDGYARLIPYIEKFGLLSGTREFFAGDLGGATAPQLQARAEKLKRDIETAKTDVEAQKLGAELTRIQAQLAEVNRSTPEARKTIDFVPPKAPGRSASRASGGREKSDNYVADVFGASFADLERFRSELERTRSGFIGMIEPQQKFFDQLNDLDRMAPLLGLSADQVERIRDALRAQADEAEFGKPLQDIIDKTPEAQDLVKELGLTFTSAFEDAVIGGKGLRDVLSGIEQDILRIITRKLVTEPLENAVTGAIGGSGGAAGLFDKLFGGLAVSILGAKDGGIFPGGITPFASGGLVSRPTLGLVGEGRMSEAIVPLPNGRAIPVEMRGGGGGTVVMNITTPDVAGFRASQGQILADAQRALARGRRNL